MSLSSSSDSRYIYISFFYSFPVKREKNPLRLPLSFKELGANLLAMFRKSSFLVLAIAWTKLGAYIAALSELIADIGLSL